MYQPVETLYKIQYSGVFLSSIECPCDIASSSTDLVAAEGEDVVLTLNISKPRRVTWYKGGQVLADVERFQTTVSDDGLKHTLSIKCITLDENGEFLALVDDNQHGTVTSSFKISVRGMFALYQTTLELYFENQNYYSFQNIIRW